ncbi:MAG: outer membrane beta-barrel protein [Acidobacteria bacterium]|nr:outer membrane beta-barrel protein [Acidobacteriota bacterium]
MRHFRYFARLIAVAGLACLISPGLRAQGEPSDSTSDLAQRLEELQKQINSLQAELAAARMQLGESSGGAVKPSDSAPAQPAGTSLVSEPQAGAPEAGPGSPQNFFGSTSVTGFVDGYYGYNFNHPHSRTSDFRAFDGPTNQFSLNMIQLIFNKAPDPGNSRLGYRLAFGYGEAMNVVNGSDPAGLGFAQYLKEAYFSYLAPVGANGLQFDFGKFVTPHGAEVIETQDNWNYSRGVLFTYAIPFYHFGLRSKYAFNDKYALTGFLVNGWNNVVDNNTGKTVGVGFGWTPNSKFSLTQNYMAGPEMEGLNKNWRQLTDTVVSISPTDRLSFILNYDYGRGDRADGLLDPVSWQGWAGYVRYKFSDRNAFALRYEWFNDSDGFTTGAAQQLKEFTGTFERRIANRLITRWEYRYDYSNQPSFTKGDSPVGSQSTVAAGLIYSFDMREAQ